MGIDIERRAYQREQHTQNIKAINEMKKAVNDLIKQVAELDECFDKRMGPLEKLGNRVSVLEEDKGKMKTELEANTKMTSDIQDNLSWLVGIAKRFKSAWALLLLSIPIIGPTAVEITKWIIEKH